MKTVRDMLGLPKPVRNVAHEFVLAVMLCSRMLDSAGRALLKGAGLTEAQFNIMMLLKHQFPGGTTQIEISRRMLVNRANVTGLIARMIGSGLVHRSRVGCDLRSYRVSLTPAGFRRLAVAEKAYFKGIEKLSSGASDARLSKGVRILLSVCEVLEKERAVGNR